MEDEPCGPSEKDCFEKQPLAMPLRRFAALCNVSVEPLQDGIICAGGAGAGDGGDGGELDGGLYIICMGISGSSWYGGIGVTLVQIQTK